MFDLSFQDFIESKYKTTGQFKNGLAKVMNYNNLWGYIDTKGKEVIPCQFSKAYDFSEGMAAVSNEENLFGYIDINGELKIPYQYKNAKYFSEELAPVEDQSGWNYIDKNGNIVITGNYEEAVEFINGFAIIKIKGKQQKKAAHINKDGKNFGYYNWVFNFINGKSLINDGQEIFFVDSNYKKIKTFKFEGSGIYQESCGYNLVKVSDNNYYFINENGEKILPNLLNARSFQNDAAYIQLNEYLIGFITKDGHIICFDKNSKYSELKDFSEGLAPVKSISGLWGYINKEGKEVIPCKYKEVDLFSEGLAGVIDKDDKWYYINKNGTKKIKIPSIYKSVLSNIENAICINATSERELCEKKLEILNLFKQQVLQQVDVEFGEVSTGVASDLYQLSKKKTKPKKQNV